MAEQTVLTSIDIDMSKALQDAQSLKQTINLLNKEIKDAKEKGGDTSAEYIKLSSSLKVVQAEYNTQTKLIGKIVEAETTEANTLKQVKAELAAVTIEWNKSTKISGENSEATKKLSARKLELTEALKREEKATGDARRNVGNYTEAMQGLPGPIGNAANSVQTLGKAFKALLANPVVLVIGAIVGALAGLYKAFTSTDSGATEMVARMEQVKAIFDVVRQRAVALLGAFKSLFSGDFKKAGEEFKETFRGIGEQINQAAEAAYNYQYALDAIEDSQNNFISRQAEIRNQIAKLEYTAQDRSKSTTERKKALEEAIALSEEEVAVQKDLNKKKLDEEAKYLAEKAGLRGEDVIAFIRMTDEEQANASESLKTLRNNNEDKFKEIEQYYADWLNADTRFFEENKRNISKYSSLQAELQKEQAAAAAENAVQVMRDELDAFLAGSVELQSIQEDITSKTDELFGTSLANRLEAARIYEENRIADLESTLFGELELRRQVMAQQEQEEIAHAEKVGADTKLIEKKYAKAKIELARAERDAKLNLAADFANNIATIAGENTAVGKAAAVAATAISTFQAATSSYASLASIPIVGPVLGAAAAAAAVVAGLANVKKILSVKSGLPGEGSVSAPGISGGSEPTPVATINPEIGAGIISRDTAEITQAAQSSGQVPVLVVEEVTAKQGIQESQQKSAVI